MKKSYFIIFNTTIASIIAVLVAMVTLNFFTFYRNAIHDLETAGKTSLSLETEQIESYIEKNKDLLQVTAMSAEYLLRTSASREVLKGLLRQSTQTYKSEIDNNTKGIYGCFKGKYLDGNDYDPGDSYNPKTREWYIKAKEAGGKPVLISPYIDYETHRVVISMSKLLEDGESVISIDMEIMGLQKLTQEISMNGLGYGFLTDRNGTIIAHNNSVFNGFPIERTSKAFSNFPDKVRDGQISAIRMKIDGNPCTVFSRKVCDKWISAMVISNKTLYHDLYKVLFRNIVAVTIVILIIWIFTRISYGSMRNSAKKEEMAQIRLDEMNREIIHSLARAIDAKDRYTNGHSSRVAEYSSEIARRMGKSEKECEEIFFAGLLHDVGKIRVSGNVINKKSMLNEDEYNQIKIHPVTGYHILKDIYENRNVAVGAKFHHERYDGKGYPHGLKGENIPEIARIIGVADTYDAMTSNRSYRKALPQNIVRMEIENGKGTQFDPKIADIMISIIDEDTEYKLREKGGSDKKILVIDDEPINEQIIRTMLEDTPIYSVTGSTRADEALDLLEKEQFDIILLDIRMPDIDGFTLYEKIREHYDIPVVIMTGEKNAETVNRSLVTEIDDFITKPIQAFVLKEILHSIFINIK